LSPIDFTLICGIEIGLLIGFHNLLQKLRVLSGLIMKGVNKTVTDTLRHPYPAKDAVHPLFPYV
jgi:hypothetical protein